LQLPPLPEDPNTTTTAPERHRKFREFTENFKDAYPEIPKLQTAKKDVKNPTSEKL
jgi:hypothetical protein